MTPFLTGELKNPHGYDPTQTNELLTAASAGSGGAAGGITGQANLEAARTRNSSGFAPALDEAARSRDKAMAGQSEGVAAQDAMLGQQHQQQAASGLMNLYGVNTGDELKSMGLSNDAVNTEVNADKAGWLQNMTDIMGALGQGAAGAGKLIHG